MAWVNLGFSRATHTHTPAYPHPWCRVQVLPGTGRWFSVYPYPYHRYKLRRQCKIFTTRYMTSTTTSSTILEIIIKKVIYTQRESQSAASSSSSPFTSGRTAATFTSSSLTYPIKLHTPTQRRARIDWTDKRLCTCESRSWPWLNVHSTSIDMAVILYMYQ